MSKTFGMLKKASRKLVINEKIRKHIHSKYTISLIIQKLVTDETSKAMQTIHTISLFKWVTNNENC